MTAPHDVFILWPINEEDGDGLAVPKQTALGTGVRYLRADLKCGECQRMKHEKTRYGDTTTCTYERWRTGLRDRAAAACMKFIPLLPNHVICGSGKEPISPQP